MKNKVNTINSINHFGSHLLNANETSLTIDSRLLAIILWKAGGPKDAHEEIKRTIEEFASYQAITFHETLEVYEIGVEEIVYNIGEEASYLVMEEYYPDISAHLKNKWKEIKGRNLIQSSNTINSLAMMPSLEIAELADKLHKNVMADIRNLISQEVITELNFQPSTYKDSTGRSLPAFNLDFDATMVLVTGYDPHRRMAIIKRWRELESGEAKPSGIDLREIDHLKALLETQTVRAETYQEMIKEDAPKVAYVDDVIMQTEGMITLGDYGRILKSREKLPTGQKKIYSQLRNAGIIMKSKPLPYNKYVERGYFVINQIIARNRLIPQAFITPKGQVWVHQKLNQYMQSSQ